ncbi:MAG: hypothetical protein OZ924_11895, partial [Burkholderiaceae bacterium]|nr:hypothetical protein [Burkholderiaceae bacterium]
LRLDLVDFLFGAPRGFTLGGQRIGAGAGSRIGGSRQQRFARPARLVPFLAIEQRKDHLDLSIRR